MCKKYDGKYVIDDLNLAIKKEKSLFWLVLPVVEKQLL